MRDSIKQVCWATVVAVGAGALAAVVWRFFSIPTLLGFPSEPDLLISVLVAGVAVVLPFSIAIGGLRIGLAPLRAVEPEETTSGLMLTLALITSLALEIGGFGTTLAMTAYRPRSAQELADRIEGLLQEQPPDVTAVLDLVHVNHIGTSRAIRIQKTIITAAEELFSAAEEVFGAAMVPMPHPAAVESVEVTVSDDQATIELTHADGTRFVLRAERVLRSWLLRPETALRWPAATIKPKYLDETEEYADALRRTFADLADKARRGEFGSGEEFLEAAAVARANWKEWHPD